MTPDTNLNESEYAHGNKRWIDVIKNTSGGGYLIWRRSEEDFNTGATLIVMPGESALFVKGGVIEQEFDEGTYKLSTENYPFVSRLRNAFSGGVSTFNCIVYFVRSAHTKELPWGFSLQVRDPKLHIHTRLMVHGAYKIRVAKPALFLTKLVGGCINFMSEEALVDYFRNEFTQYIKSFIGDYIKMSDQEILGIVALQNVLAQECGLRVGPVFSGYGLELINFSIAGLEIPEDDPNRQKLESAYATKTESGIYADEYGKFVEREILMDIAKNPSGGIAAAGAGLAMGLGADPLFGGMSKDVLRQNAVDFHTVSPLELMKELKGMRDIDAITQEEYEEKKRELLSRM